jgi:hypothetical protein
MSFRPARIKPTASAWGNSSPSPATRPRSGAGSSYGSESAEAVPALTSARSDPEAHPSLASSASPVVSRLASDGGWRTRTGSWRPDGAGSRIGVAGTSLWRPGVRGIGTRKAEARSSSATRNLGHIESSRCRQARACATRAFARFVRAMDASSSRSLASINRVHEGCRRLPAATNARISESVNLHLGKAESTRSAGHLRGRSTCVHSLAPQAPTVPLARSSAMRRSRAPFAGPARQFRGTHGSNPSGRRVLTPVSGGSHGGQVSRHDRTAPTRDAPGAPS